MHTEDLRSTTIDQAAEQIIRKLKEGTASSSSRRNVFYFDGWDGLGASAVLREVSRRLAAEAAEPAPARRRAPAAGLEFSQIFHIDCSKWESRREMQRVIAVQLGLPAQVMDMLDAQDEEDDYRGVGKGSRDEIPQVAAEIFQHIQKLNCRFLVVFHNGSSKEIDLESFGFPLSGYLGNKVLWTFQGRFRLYPRTKVDSALKSIGKTDVFLSASDIDSDDLPLLLAKEAAEVERELKIGGIDRLAQAIENCFLYTMKLCSMGKGNCDYDLATHSCNYWKCDGVAKQLQHGSDDDRLLWFYDALQCEMRLDVDYYQNPYLQSPVARRLSERISYWTSPTYGSMLIPDQHGHIPEGMFQQFDKLCVLKLSACKFSFTSPPFLCCHNLKFLWLDRCQDERGTDDEAGKEEDIRRFFQRLWVLDVRYSEAASALLSAKMMDFMTQLRELNVMGENYLHMEHLHGRLHNIRKLRVTESMTICLTDPEDLFSGMNKMELLHFSGNIAYHRDHLLSVGTSCSSLETIIIDGYNSIEKISLIGCAKLKDLFLSGTFYSLRSLDITGSVVKTLDLSAVTAPFLDELNLLDCGKLCAILWPTSAEANRKKYLSKLTIIDTTQKESTAAGDHTVGRPTTEFDWHISIRDARLLGSLEPVKDYFGSHDAHVEISTISTPSRPCADAAGSRNKGIKSSSRQRVQVNLRQHKGNALNADVAAAIKDNGMKQQANEVDSGAWTTMSVCPPPPGVPPQGCYIHIEDQKTATRLRTASITLPGFICDSAKILHVHDSLFITNILASPLGSTTWSHLEWCQVERCPKLDHVFSSRTSNVNIIFENLKTIWASHLPKARFICEWEILTSAFLAARAFVNLTLLHIYCCPRLVYSISVPITFTDTMRSLETLEIMWCGDLTVVIKEQQDQGHSRIFWIFPKLKRIHLHELPMLRGISYIEVPMVAPSLETIKIRGCWSFKRLPLRLPPGKPYADDKKVVECDCEKEWWDRLEWDSEEHFNYYKPTHPRYYKKTMLRGCVLR
ncbi:hypothetical protein ACP70R_011951 [Stipagrostis hirtigluma subsp. patula]